MIVLTDKIKNSIKILLIVLVIIFGIYLRTVSLLQYNSFFMDEGLLMLVFQEKTYLQMFFPLSHIQAAPPIFMIISKLIYHFFGVNELALRFLPYMLGNLSLVLFYFLLKKIYKNYFAILITLFAFATNSQLIWKTAELKPYVIDVLFTIIALIVAFTIDLKALNKKKAFCIGLLAALSVWCSYPMLFLVAGISIVFLFKIYFLKDDNLKNLFWIYAIPNLIGFIIYYKINLVWLTKHTELHKYWSVYEAFAPKSYADYSALTNFFFMDSNIIIITVLGLIGIYFIYRYDRFVFWILMSPIAVCLAASYLGLYPFAHRLVLFILPILIIFLFKPLDEIRIDKKIFTLFFIVLYTLFFIPVGIFLSQVVQKRYSFAYSNVKSSYIQLKNDITQNELIYVSIHDLATFKIYNHNLKIPENQIIYSQPVNLQLKSYKKELDMLPHSKIIWFVLTNNEFSKKEYDCMEHWIEANTRILERKENGESIVIKAYHG